MSLTTGSATDRASAEGLPAVWRSRAKALRRYGSDAPAVALERCADELETTLRERDETGLSLVEAARESGYSADHLGRLVRDGKIPNAGRQARPGSRVGTCPGRRRSSRARSGRIDDADSPTSSSCSPSSRGGSSDRTCATRSARI